MYQNPRAPTLTFTDIYAELALCFELPGAESDTCQNGDDVVDSWANSIAFALTDAPGDADATGYPAFITRKSLHKKLPGLSSPSMRQPRTVTYHIVLHKSYILTAGSLKDHLHGLSSIATPSNNAANMCSTMHSLPSQTPPLSPSLVPSIQ